MSQISIKVAWHSPESETTLDHTTFAISLLFLWKFLYEGEMILFRNGPGRDFTLKTNSWGAGIRISWVENFEKLISVEGLQLGNQEYIPQQPFDWLV